MDVSIIGCGYVGTVVGASLAYNGHNVFGIDIDEDRVSTLRRRESPYNEKELSDILNTVPKNRFQVSTDYDAVNETSVSILCLPTPGTKNGDLNYGPLKTAITSLCNSLNSQPESHTIVLKSTVFPSVSEETLIPIISDVIGESHNIRYSVNPEFLSKGSGVRDFLDPDKVVIGAKNVETQKVVSELYSPFVDESSIIYTGIIEAELVKIANNAFLASKISVSNELGNIAKMVGADGREVMSAVSRDSRINHEFTNPGLGFGGGCLIKDITALQSGVSENGYNPDLLQEVLTLNEAQINIPVEIIKSKTYDNLSKVCILGASYKQGTADTTNSPGVMIANKLARLNVDVIIYDSECDRIDNSDDHIQISDSLERAIKSSDSVIVTNGCDCEGEIPDTWLNNKLLIDCKGITVNKSNLDYRGICW